MNGQLVELTFRVKSVSVGGKEGGGESDVRCDLPTVHSPSKSGCFLNLNMATTR